MSKASRIHPAVLNAAGDHREGKMNRREFLRFATLLGASVPVAYALAGCGAAPAAEAPAAGAPAGSDTGAEAASGAVKRGGTWTASMQLQLLDHPARLSWVEGANIVRQMNEYLTETGPDNITRPLLLDRWEASDDVKTWDLYLKQGIKFNNGDDLTADDVIFTMGEWLNPDVGSSMLGLLGSLGSIDNVEKVDDYHIRLNLETPDIAIPESLFHYPAVILHRDFEGDIVKQPIGTGPFMLEEYAEGERARFTRREDYWQNGEDGDPLPYLDELIFVSTDKDAGVAALQSGQVDTMYDPRPSDFQALQGMPDLTIRPVSTAQCLVLRMRVDLEPWDDNRVRTALKMCQDRAKILQLAYFGEGDLSIDAHFAPIHPAYAEKPIPAYDPDGARALLEEYAAEKGIELPLKVTLATKNDQNEPELAQALKELAEPAGFDITLDITEPGGYWDRWTEVDLGITSWTHRPLGVMIAALAYTKESIGAWNETRWYDDDFTELLNQAQSTLDVDARRELYSQMEDIMQERGPIGNSFWKNVWNITRSEFQNVVAHPTAYFLMADVWKDA
ncbi:MAG: ABC transporter substrate-binding protein [Candidatus Promineofilum sp.]|uniref:ABC transporter substrate-binding protein n=1 Tax=Promineifilum sp. TaxID=2664178 RepID=UPI001D8EE5BF|nr:ABC transporter substrate-binding protein [Caldilineaceae bacterium]MCO5182101.1 ABC transporter substrate-binding protein [Promineifilum sp.]